MPGGESLPLQTPPQTLRDFERALRGLGFSRNQAASIARGGFKAVQADQVGDQLEELADAARRYADLFKS